MKSAHVCIVLYAKLLSVEILDLCAFNDSGNKKIEGEYVECIVHVFGKKRKINLS
jgi:hypothetical protein